MTPQISTDPSQSKRLLDCVVSYMAADMTLSHRDNDGSYELIAIPFHHGCFDEKDLPSWSLPALLALLPSSIDIDEDESEPIVTYDLVIYPRKGWVVEYIECEEESGDSLEKTEDASLVEAAVRMIETLVKNRIKLNKQ